MKFYAKMIKISNRLIIKFYKLYAMPRHANCTRLGSIRKTRSPEFRRLAKPGRADEIRVSPCGLGSGPYRRVFQSRFPTYRRETKPARLLGYLTRPMANDIPGDRRPPRIYGPFRAFRIGRWAVAKMRPGAPTASCRLTDFAARRCARPAI